MHILGANRFQSLIIGAILPLCFLDGLVQAFRVIRLSGLNAARHLLRTFLRHLAGKLRLGSAVVLHCALEAEDQLAPGVH